MKLLLDREQKACSVFSLVPLRVGSGSIFSLNAELELEEDEKSLIEKYKFNYAPIVASSTLDDLKKSIPPAIFVGLIVFVLVWMGAGFFTALPLCILTTLIMTIVYFKTEREQILVSDLMNGGRKFRCDSVVDLVHKEAFLESVSQYLRQVLETSKHWDDREAITIKPLDKASAKLTVLKAL